jgi:hypothetical protein
MPLKRVPLGTGSVASYRLLSRTAPVVRIPLMPEPDEIGRAKERAKALKDFARGGKEI